MGRLSSVRGLACLVGVAYLLLALPLLSKHGVTYDAPALFYAGDRTWFFAWHPGVEGALDFKRRGEPAGFHSFFSREDEWADPMRYPVLPALVSAGVAAATHDWLGILDPAAAHHLGLVLLNALALLLYARYAMALLGTGAGLAASIALLLLPSAFGHSFNNPKDWPCAMFYAVAILAAGVGVLQARPRTILLAGVFAGVSLAAKMNGLFIVGTLLLWLPVAYILKLRHDSTQDRLRVSLALLAAPYLAVAVFVFSWPWLWAGGLVAGWDRLNVYLAFMLGYGVGPRDTWSAYPLRCVFFMTPPIVLLAALIGSTLPWRERSPLRRATVALLLLWLAVPLFRTAMPHSNFYDANRHFIEYVPALCALAGVGFWLCWTALSVRMARLPPLPKPWILPAIDGVLAGAAVVALVLPLLKYAPFETSYFNVFIGGLGGAQRHAVFRMSPPSDLRSNGTEGDFWYQSLRSAFAEAAKLVPTPADIALCSAPAILGQANLNGLPFRPVRFGTIGSHLAPVVWVSPREGGCNWRLVRQLETQRPILLRVERDGGLIYELLGAPSQVQLEPTSNENPYSRGV